MHSPEPPAHEQMSQPQPDTPLEPQVLDIQHDTDPEDDHGPARRIPHLGHAILFFSLAATICLLCILMATGAVMSLTHSDSAAVVVKHPAPILAAQALGYVLTLLLSVWLFPRLWGRSFLHGIQWNVLAAHRRWLWLIPTGVGLSLTAQAALNYLPSPKSAPIDNMFITPASAWTTAIIAVFFAPIFEEIAFRGFLLPALATAYDWLSMERSPAGFERWQASTSHTATAVVFGALFSSVPFALLHAEQISFAWAALGVLFCVSLMLSYIRINTYSVACSALVHASYNGTIFLVMIFATGGFRHLEKLTP